MLKHIIASLLLGWMLAGVAHAQGVGIIEGTVTARGSGAPLTGATVRVIGIDGMGALTDAHGAFRITRVPLGSHKISVENYGWETVEIVVDVGADTAPLHVSLAESPVQVAAVTVTATGAAQKQMTSTVSIGAVTAQQIRETKPSHPSQIVGGVPGVYVSVAGSGEGHMTAIRQPLTTNPVYLYLEDGVPTRSTGFFNHNALYEVNVPQAGRIEILKGPGTALYGSDAIGGVINVQTRAPSENTTAELYAEGGSFTWNRMLASFSGTRGANALRADLNLTRWGGWRDAADYDRESATVRWDHVIGAHASLKTLLTYSRIDQIDASPLSRQQYESVPELNYYLFTTRNISALRASTDLEIDYGASHFRITPYVRRNEMDIVPFWMLTFDPVRYRTGNKSAGVLLRARTALSPLRATVTAGVDVDYSPGERREHQIQMMRDGATFASYTTGDLVYDYAVAFHAVSPYIELDLQPRNGLRLSLGGRYDMLGFDYDNHLPATSTGRYRRPADTSVAYHQLSPKLGAAWELRPWLGVFASVRESFRSPSESQIFRQGSSINTTALRPIVAKSREAGARGVLGRFDYELSAYDMRVEDDVLTFIRADGTREVQNAGATRHRGIELGAGVQLAQWLRISAAQSWSHQTYEQWRPLPDVSYAGHEVERAPRGITNLRLRIKPALEGAVASLEWSRISRYWEDPENTHLYEGHSLLNFDASYPIKWGVAANLRVLNLTNTRYAENAQYNPADGELLTPGSPRLVYIGLQARWPQ